MGAGRVYEASGEPRKVGRVHVNSRPPFLPLTARRSGWSGRNGRVATRVNREE